MLKCLNYCGSGDKVLKSFFKYRVAYPGIRNVGKRYAELLQYLRGGKQAALAVAQTVAVRFRGVVTRAPQQKRLIYHFGQSGNGVFRTEIAVRSKHRVHASIKKTFCCFFGVHAQMNKPFLVQKVEVYKLNIFFAEHFLDYIFFHFCVRFIKKVFSGEVSSSRRKADFYLMFLFILI